MVFKPLPETLKFLDGCRARCIASIFHLALNQEICKMFMTAAKQMKKREHGCQFSGALNKIM
jgi:hypothetical protein